MPDHFVLPEKVLEPFEVREKNTNKCSLSESPGRVSAESVWAYPPGIPVLLPGERIPVSFPEEVSHYAGAGIPLYASSQGVLSEEAACIYVCSVP